MKNFIFLLLLCGSVISAQNKGPTTSCISGPNSITLNETATYTASGADCYYWSVTSGLEIIGSKKNASVTVKCTGSGGTLSLVKFLDGVCTNCSKAITCESSTCDDTPTAYFIPDHTFNYVWKSLSTISPSNYTSIEWTTTESRVVQINPDDGPDPVITLTSGPVPVTLDFTAIVTYPDGCVYEVDFSVGFSYNQPLYNEGFMNLAPSPADNYLSISFEESVSGTLSIVELITGNELKAIQISDQKEVDVDVNGLNVGVYLIRLTDENGYVVDKRVVID